MSAHQDYFNSRLWNCQPGEPCEYHRDRFGSVPFALEADLVQPTSSTTASLAAHRETIELARLFEGGTPPAGGWNLVREQREWLREELTQIFLCRRAAGAKVVRILEAGVAGYVHHFTYLKILVEAARAVARPADLVLHLTVVDRCRFPLEQISAVSRELARGVVPRRLAVEGQRVTLAAPFLRLLESDLEEFRRIETRLSLLDLRDSDAVLGLVRQAGEPYDVITEHFLTSVLYKDLDGDVARTRQSYARILRPGGSLLTANGFSVGSAPFDRLVEVHESQGLRLAPASTRAVWDPFGLSKGELGAFLRGEPDLSVALEDSLARFVRE